jgi:hypothetical protein
MPSNTYLPQLKADVLDVLLHVQLGVILEVGVVNVRCNPDALELGVLDPAQGVISQIA